MTRAEVISYFYGYKDRPHLVSHVHSSLGGGAVYKLYYDDRDRDRERSLKIRSVINLKRIPDTYSDNQIL